MSSAVWSTLPRTTNLEQHKEERAYFQSAIGELSDLIMQCRILAEHLGASFEELMPMGEERFTKRMDQLRAKTGRFS